MRTSCSDSGPPCYRYSSRHWTHRSISPGFLCCRTIGKCPVRRSTSFSIPHSCVSAWSKPRTSCRKAARGTMQVPAEPSSLPTEEVAVILVDHGSKRAEANDMLLEFASLYRESSRYKSVEIAHMELAEPSIGTAVAKCASAGCKTAVIAPYFLSRGRHITSDIPALVAEAQLANPGVRCIIAEPIGVDPMMAQIIENRVVGALQTAL